MKIVEVNDKKTWKWFHEVPKRIYKGNRHWICPLEADVQGIFTPEKNRAFNNGSAKCFVLFDEQGVAAGRIAAFIDHERNAKQRFPSGGIGFFECTHDETYAFALFEHAAGYLSQWDVKAIDGPVNFGEREKFTGLLVRGFEFEPLYQENYQPPYYKKLFEKWGFRPFEQILTFRGKVSDVPIHRFSGIAERVTSRYPVVAKEPDLNKLDQFADDFNEVYNSAFAKFDHFKPLSKAQTLKLFQDSKPVVDRKTVSFTYWNGRPASFCILLPEINPFLRSARGKMRWWNLLWFFLRFKTARIKSMKGLAFGVHADYQKKGLFAVMVSSIYFKYQPDLSAVYDYFYLSTIRAHNKIMVDSVLNLGVEVNRIHIAYRKTLGPEVPFEPYDFMEEAEKPQNSEM